MTFSSAPLSSLEVDDVVAIAAGTDGLRTAGGGNAACWRVAGAIAALGRGSGDGFGGAVFAVADLSLLLSVSFALSAVLGTTLRAIGRGFGSGTFDLAAGSFAQACDPRISASVVAIAVERKALARADRVTASLFGRITKDLSSNV
jgi:hypothetical protein